MTDLSLMVSKFHECMEHINKQNCKDCIQYLIVLDSFEYRQREQEFITYLKDEAINPYFFYSKYENRITEIFQRTRIIGGVITHIIYWILSLEYAIKLFDKKYAKYNNIIFINPIVGIFYSLLSRIFFINKNITIGGFLFENKNNRVYLTLRKWFVNFSYKKVNHIFVYGENEVTYYSKIFPKLGNKFKYIKYGRDFCYKDKKDFSYDIPYIASGGRSNRDFETLCTAMHLLEGEKDIPVCLIATRPEAITAKIEQSPVKIQYGITLNQFGSFIDHSIIFVLPLLNTTLSAGHMVMMEVLSHGKPIIVTDIPSIRNYVSEEQVTFYKPGNAEDLANKIQYVLKNLHSKEIVNKIKNGRMLYETDFSFKSLLKRIIQKSIEFNNYE